MTTLEIVRRTKAWCAVMNIGLLVVWFLFISVAHDGVYRLHSKWFNLSVETFDGSQYRRVP